MYKLTALKVMFMTYTVCSVWIMRRNVRIINMRQEFSEDRVAVFDKKK